MSIQAEYPIGLTSVVNEFNPNFTPRGVVISNYSADNIAFDNTVDHVLLIPPGVVAPIAINHYVSTLRVRSATNTTGYATITIMDSQPDVTHAPNLQQLPGTITATIPSTLTVSGGVTTTPAAGSNQAVTITGTPAVTINGTPTVTINGTPTVAISGTPTVAFAAGSQVAFAPGQQVGFAPGQRVYIAAADVTLAVGDSTTQGNTGSTAGNTGTLLGLLTHATIPFTLTSGQVHNETLTAPISGFYLTATITGAGRLNVSVTANGVTVYRVRNRAFYGSPLGRNPVEKWFNAALPAGATINVSWDDAITSAAFALRY
jgi:hypothetical protein